jgi:hypothetical protein
MEATASAESASAEGVRPFTIDIPCEQIKDLRSRIEATRWPGKEIVAQPAQSRSVTSSAEAVASVRPICLQQVATMRRSACRSVRTTARCQCRFTCTHQRE